MRSTRRSEKLEVAGKVKGWEKDSAGNLMVIEIGSSVGGRRGDGSVVVSMAE